MAGDTRKWQLCPAVHQQPHPLLLEDSYNSCHRGLVTDVFHSIMLFKYKASMEVCVCVGGVGWCVCVWGGALSGVAANMYYIYLNTVTVNLLTVTVHSTSCEMHS